MSGSKLVTYQVGETLEGPAGEAVSLQRVDHEGAPPHGEVATWFLTCPGQAIAWHQYVLAIIHLRPVDGLPAPVITEPDATHEVLLFALDPNSDRHGPPDPTDQDTWRPLTPYNLVHQVKLPDDTTAIWLIRLAAQAIVDGRLWAEPPLAHQREPWTTALNTTAAHLRGEPH